MGRSLEYIKKRIEEGNCRDMSMEEFQDICEIPFKSYFLEDCGDYMIIAIRKDSDEELAAWIASMTTVCECCAEINECESPECFNKCLHGVEDWLQQLAEGE